MTDRGPDETPNEQRSEKRGADGGLIVISVFVGAIFLLTALLFFAY